MSTLAYVSGRLGKALTIDQGQQWVFDRDIEKRRIAPGELSELLSPGAEIKIFPVDSAEAVRSHLDVEILFQDALFLFLSSCDTNLSVSARIMCGQELEGLLENHSLEQRLVSRMLSRPMPVAVRASRQETISLFGSFDLLVGCLRRVFGLQEWCDEVHAAWEEFARGLPADQASELEAELTEDGTLASIVEAASTKELHHFNAEFISQSIRRRHPLVDKNAKDALTEIRGALLPRLCRGLERQRPLPMRGCGSKHRPQSNNAIADALRRTGEMDGATRLSAFEAKTRVDKQIVAIESELFSGREDLAEKYIAELVDFQLSHSEKEHLAKSLCNLAGIALDANRLEIADRLSQYAVNLEVEDSAVYTTRAEVLKTLGYFAASLDAFKEAKIRFPGTTYSWGGIADVLREMGLYDQSLAAYTEAQDKFPDSPVPFNGYISTLRAQGNRKAAIEYALRVVQRFPDDAVSRSSLALALRDRGKYSDAVRQYQAALQIDGRNPRIILGYLSTLCLTTAGTQGALDFLQSRLQGIPQNASLLNAKAYYLRRAGRLSESLAVAEKLSTDQPNFTPARFNCSATLVALGRTEEARKVLPITDHLRSELDWSGLRIYAMALAAEGRLAEAAEHLKIPLRSCPWRREQLKISTTLGYIQMKLGNTSDSVATLERDLLSLDEATKQVRLVLLGGAQARAGNYAVAGTLLRNVASTRDPLLACLRQNYLDTLWSVCSQTATTPERIEIQLLLAA